MLLHQTHSNTHKLLEYLVHYQHLDKHNQLNLQYHQTHYIPQNTCCLKSPLHTQKNISQQLDKYMNHHHKQLKSYNLKLWSLYSLSFHINNCRHYKQPMDHSYMLLNLYSQIHNKYNFHHLLQQADYSLMLQNLYSQKYPDKECAGQHQPKYSVEILPTLNLPQWSLQIKSNLYYLG